jgi:hypothetical protein
MSPVLSIISIVIINKLIICKVIISGVIMSIVVSFFSVHSEICDTDRIIPKLYCTGKLLQGMELNVFQNYLLLQRGATDKVHKF